MKLYLRYMKEYKKNTVTVFLPNCGREKNLNVVLTNASGFGGLHAAMILKKYID